MKLVGKVVLAAALFAAFSLPMRAGAQETDDRASLLESSIDSLRMEAKYARALEGAKGLLALRRSDPKAKAYEIGDAERLAATLEFISGLPPAKQQEMAEADRLTAQCETLDTQGNYAEAVALAEKQLDTRKRILGEENAEVVNTSSRLAGFLHKKGDYATAEPLFREALAKGQELLGGDHPDIAWNLNELASLLQDKGDYAAAEPLCREGLAMRRRLFGDEDMAVVSSLGALGCLLYEKGDLTGAEPFFREALAMSRRLLGDDHPDVADNVSNYAALLSAKGDYAAAEPLCRRVLAMERETLGDEHPYVAASLNNLALVLKGKGDYLAAESCARESLAMARKLLGNEHPLVATSLSSLSSILYVEGNYAAAEPLNREALALRRKLLGDEHPHVAMSLNNLATILHGKKDYAGAEACYREALALFRKSLGNEHPYVAAGMNNVAGLLSSKGDYAAAEPLFREALAMNRRFLGEEHPDIAWNLNELARLLHAKGDDAAAEPLLFQAATIYEVSRLRAGTGLERVTFQKSPYSLLAHVYLVEGKTEDAWPAVERDLGRALADLLVTIGSRSLTLTEAAREDSLKQTLDDCEHELGTFRKAAAGDTTGEMSRQVELTRTRLLATEAEWHAFQRELAAKYPIEEGQAYSLGRVQKALPKRAAIVGWLDVRETEDKRALWGYAIRHTGPVVWERLGEGEEGDNMTPADRGRLFRDALVSPGLVTAGARQYARSLWDQCMAPFSAALRGVTDLIVIPSGAMLGVPVEALIDEDGTTIGDRFAISYAPSATIYTWLRERAETLKEKKGKTLLIGDPPFTEAQRAAMEQEKETEGVELASSGVSPEVATLRYALTGNEEALAELPRLPATRREVTAISSLTPDPMLLLGTDASEETLVHLAGSEALRAFSIIHIATHALVDDARPERSALVLSRVNLPDPVESAMTGTRIYDGLVTAEEVVREWALDANLVTLSACETGLGKEVGGEGYIGLSHAFLQSGARSLLVSLWKVEDRATSLLMQRFYQNYLGRYGDSRHGKKGKPMPKAEALQEAKQWLRNYVDEDGRKPFEHPCYWSAFILIGDRG
jgi:CHAT domain-containing protein